MKRKNKSKSRSRSSSSSKQNVFLWLAVIIVFIMLFVVLYVTGVFNQFSVAGGDGGLNSSENYVPPLVSACSSLDISAEHRLAFGDSAIDNLRAGCDGVSGLWTENSNEMSCYFDPTVFTMNCSSPNNVVLKNFCENLGASYTCDASLAYAGCYCSGFAPGVWGSDVNSSNQSNQDDQLEFYGGVGALFTTNLKWNGASGGLSGLDEKCTFQAHSAGFNGSWVAIAGDGVTPVDFRLPSSLEIRRVDGVKVVDAYQNLFDGSGLFAPMNVDENLNIVGGFAWTGSMGDGSVASDCHDWGWVSAVGVAGSVDSLDSSAIFSDEVDCDSYNHFYCVRLV